MTSRVTRVIIRHSSWLCETQAPSTRIRRFLKTEVFFSRFRKNPRSHVAFSNRFCLSTRIRIFLKTDVFWKSPRSHVEFSNHFNCLSTTFDVIVFENLRFPLCSHGSKNIRLKNTYRLETVFKELRFRLPKTQFTCGQKLYPEEKNSVFKNIRIRVDRASYPTNGATSAKVNIDAVKDWTLVVSFGVLFTRGRKAPESRFRLRFLLFVFFVFKISCSVTKPKAKLCRAFVRLGYIPRGRKFRGEAIYFGKCAFRITVNDCPRCIQNAHTSLLLQW